MNDNNIYKKENGIMYNAYNAAIKNFKIFTISFIFILIMWVLFSKRNLSHFIHIFFTFGVVILNAYFIHRYADFTGFSYLHQYHHDSNINKTWYALLTETIINLIIAGGIYLLVFNIIFNHQILIPIPVFIWSLYYTSVHMYTYHHYNVKSHTIHHDNQNYNYGPDIADIIYETKYDGDEYEDLNITIPNAIIIFLIFFMLLLNFEKVRKLF
jgi:hypothetical protein